MYRWGNEGHNNRGCWSQQSVRSLLICLVWSTLLSSSPFPGAPHRPLEDATSDGDLKTPGDVMPKSHHSPGKSWGEPGKSAPLRSVSTFRLPEGTQRQLIWNQLSREGEGTCLGGRGREAARSLKRFQFLPHLEREREGQGNKGRQRLDREYVTRLGLRKEEREWLLSPKSTPRTVMTGAVGFL